MPTGFAQRKGIALVALVVLALGAWVAFTSRTGNEHDARRGEVLRLARKGNLGDTDKRALFELLSGEQFGSYQFSDAERALILRAIGG
jgi:predicted negative regulator of RcsB-dependent stress response